MQLECLITAWDQSGMKGKVGGFQNPGVCLQAFPSFPSPSPLFFHAVILCPWTPQKRSLRRLNSISKSTCKHAFVFGCLNKYDMQYCCLCYVISQIVTLALLEINLFLVITVLSQEIQTVKFGFRTSGDLILLEFVLLRQSETTKYLLVFVIHKSLSSCNDVLLNF